MSFFMSRTQILNDYYGADDVLWFGAYLQFTTQSTLLARSINIFLIVSNKPLPSTRGFVSMSCKDRLNPNDALKMSNFSTSACNSEVPLNLDGHIRQSISRIEDSIESRSYRFLHPARGIPRQPRSLCKPVCQTG